MSSTLLFSDLKRLMLSLAIWCSTLLLTLTLFLLMLLVTALTFPLDPKHQLQHSLCYLWSDALIALNPYWHITVHGRKNINPGHIYVIVANHQSLLDIVMLFQLRIQFKWIAKDSLFRIPVLGWCLSLARHVCIKRGSLSSIRRLNRQASDWLDAGISMMYFPEGTRSSSGKVLKFHNGAFKLALKKQVPILPVAIQGTATAMPKHGFIFNPGGAISINVLPPLEYTDFTIGNLETLKHTVKDQITQALLKT